MNARYSGVDRQHRPFVITADVARQNPSANDIVALEQPKGDMTTAGGGLIKITARTGIYQPQTQLLDLFGDVRCCRTRATNSAPSSAHVDMANGTAEGHEPVEGEGPFGHVTGQGFRMLDRGDVIIFTGKSISSSCRTRRRPPNGERRVGRGTRLLAVAACLVGARAAGAGAEFRPRARQPGQQQAGHYRSRPTASSGSRTIASILRAATPRRRGGKRPCSAIP